MLFQRKKSWLIKEMDELFADMTLLENQDEFCAFMRDACTLRELTEISKRWKAAKLLSKGKTVREVVQKTGLSSATVSRVNQWKNSVGEGGYDLLLERTGHASHLGRS